MSSHARRRAGALLLSASATLAACNRGEKADTAAGENAQPGGAAATVAATPTFTAVSDQMLTNAGANGANWVMYGGAYNNQRYSLPDQVNKENVKNLTVAWTYQTGITKSLETTPVVVDGVMYMTTPDSHVIALNATTGAELWHFQPKLGTTVICCGPNNRGVAVHGDKVFVGTLDDHLIALNAKDGSVAWDIQIDDPAAGYSQTMAPLVADGKVIVGTSGAEYGIRGYMKAYNPADGKLLWTWYSIPAPGEAKNGWWGDWAETEPFGTKLNRNIAQEKADSAKYADAWKRGGGSMWMTPAYDPATKTLFAAIGNPSPDLDGKIRPGDNLYTESVVAVDATTGKLKWYFQTVPHDVWDLDAVSPPVLIERNGRKLVGHAGKTGWYYLLDAASPPTLFERNGRKLVGHAGKTGWYYVLDAGTGKAVLRSENFVPHENMFAPPTKEGVRMLPGANGGSEWSPTAYSPKTGLVYVLGLHQPMLYSTTSVPLKKGQLWLGSAFKAVPGEEQWGTFSAINVDDGKIAWQRRVKDPMIGGALATAGGVVFVGQANGAFDAFDAEDGEVLWRYNAGAGVNAAPMTYSVNGVQYVAVAAGGNFQIGSKNGDDLLVFALRDKAPSNLQQYEAPGYPRGSANRLGGATDRGTTADTGGTRGAGAGGAGDTTRR